jgi:hypothetical protein
MKPASSTQILGLFSITMITLGLNFLLLNVKIDAVKPSPNEYRGHIYGNKLSMPKRELDIVTGIIRHDPKYDSAVLMQEGK